MTQSGALVLVGDHDGLRTLTLNRPEKRNAVNDSLREELIVSLREADRDPTVRGLVLTGTGDAFCAGGDINGMLDRLEQPGGVIAEAGWRRQRRTHELIMTLHDLAKPTVAAVNGVASGLGADLAFSCDFVIAADTARIVLSYVTRGLIPDGGATYFLPRRVGMSRAKELIFSGRPVDAQEALAIGLVDGVVSTDELLPDVRRRLASMVGNPALPLALTKDLLNRSLEADIHELFASARLAQAACYTSADHLDAVRAFLERGSRASRAAHP